MNIFALSLFNKVKEKKSKLHNAIPHPSRIKKYFLTSAYVRLIVKKNIYMKVVILHKFIPTQVLMKEQKTK